MDQKDFNTQLYIVRLDVATHKHFDPQLLSLEKVETYLCNSYSNVFISPLNTFESFTLAHCLNFILSIQHILKKLDNKKEQMDFISHIFYLHPELKLDNYFIPQDIYIFSLSIMNIPLAAMMSEYVWDDYYLNKVILFNIDEVYNYQ